MVRAAIALIALAGGLFAQPAFDILISNAKVVDGSGNPAFYADIGMRGTPSRPSACFPAPPPPPASTREV
jgi:hypothetical protein